MFKFNSSEKSVLLCLRYIKKNITLDDLSSRFVKLVEIYWLFYEIR